MGQPIRFSKILFTAFLLLFIVIMGILVISVSDQHPITVNSNLPVETVAKTEQRCYSEIDPFKNIKLVYAGGLPEARIVAALPEGELGQVFKYEIIHTPEAVKEGDIVTISCNIRDCQCISKDYPVLYVDKDKKNGYVFYSYVVTKDNTPVLITPDDDADLTEIDNEISAQITDLCLGKRSFAVDKRINYSIASFSGVELVSKRLYYRDEIAMNDYVVKYKVVTLDNNGKEHELFLSAKVANLALYNNKVFVSNVRTPDNNDIRDDDVFLYISSTDKDFENIMLNGYTKDQFKELL